MVRIYQLRLYMKCRENTNITFNSLAYFVQIGNYILSPFWENEVGIAVNIDHDCFLYELNYVPQSKSEMNEFINNFFKIYLNSIIK